MANNNEEKIPSNIQRKKNSIRSAIMSGMFPVTGINGEFLMLSNGLGKVFIPKGEYPKDLEIANICNISKAVGIQKGHLLEGYSKDVIQTDEFYNTLTNEIYGILLGGKARLTDASDIYQNRQKMQKQANEMPVPFADVKKGMTLEQAEATLEVVKNFTRGNIAVNENIQALRSAGLDVSEIESLIEVINNDISVIEKEIISNRSKQIMNMIQEDSQLGNV